MIKVFLAGDIFNYSRRGHSNVSRVLIQPDMFLKYNVGKSLTGEKKKKIIRLELSVGFYRMGSVHK